MHYVKHNGEPGSRSGDEQRQALRGFNERRSPDSVFNERTFRFIVFVTTPSRNLRTECGCQSVTLRSSLSPALRSLKQREQIRRLTTRPRADRAVDSWAPGAYS